MTKLSPALAATLVVVAGWAHAAPPAAPAQWHAIPPGMQDQRWAPAAVLIPKPSEALVAGGYSFATGHCVTSIDLFDTNTRAFRPSHAKLHFGRDFESASLLPDGTVLIAGGFNTSWGSLDSAEIYDPATDTIHLLPARMNAPRELFTATTLKDGRILFAGGFDTTAGTTQSSAEIYDTTTQSFDPLTSKLANDRFGHAAALLSDGRVLIVGGTSWQVGSPGHALASAEIFDPVTNAFHVCAGSLSEPRDRPTASLLPDGSVLIAGGQNDKDGPRALERFDSATETFTTLPATLHKARMAHIAVTLPGGSIAFAGGYAPEDKRTTPTVERYDPATQTESDLPDMPHDSLDLAGLLLPDGTLLTAGGKHAHGAESTAWSSGQTLTFPSR